MKDTHCFCRIPTNSSKFPSQNNHGFGKTGFVLWPLIQIDIHFMVFYFFHFPNTVVNKTVLLRERKRHIPHCVGSTRPFALSGGILLLGGTHPVLAGDYPSPVLAGRYPVLEYPHLQLGFYCLGLGYPPSTRNWGTPPPGTGRDLGPVIGVFPRKDIRPVEVLWDGDGVFSSVWTDTHLWKQYLRHSSDTGGHKWLKQSQRPN